MFRPSGLPWTSKNVPLEAKAFVKIKPLAIQSQKGYKVKTRSEARYSCADRPRDVIFKENYQRRQYQVSRCGYWSDNSKPYRPVGELELDTRKLIIKTLGQQDIITQEQDKNAQLEEENRRTIKRRERKAIFKCKGLAEKQEPYCRVAEHIIKKELSEGRKRMSVVKSGSNFFQVIESEQKDKDSAAQQEKSPTYSKVNWRPSSSQSDSESELEDEDPGEVVQAWSEQQQHGYWAHLGLTTPPTTPAVRGDSGRSRKSIAPHSVYFVSTSTSVVSIQLNVLRWFLEAMRSDTPGSVTPLTSAWSSKTHEQSASAESKKITQAKWKSFIKTKYQPPGRPKSAATTILPISRAATSDTTDKISLEEGVREGSPEPTEDKPGSKPSSATVKPSSAVIKPSSASAQTKPSSALPKRPSTSPGAISSATVLSPGLMRERFCQVAESKAQSLTRHLRAMERSRNTACRKKFSSLELTGVLSRDLGDMRASVALDTDDTARRKIMYNSHWFQDLLQDLMSEVKEEPKYLVPLQRLHTLAQLQLAPKRFTKDRFLAVLLTLRDWEMSLPVVANVIKFICDRVIFLPSVEYNEWYAAHFH